MGAKNSILKECLVAEDFNCCFADEECNKFDFVGANF